MAKNTQPIAKRCKALGISPAVMGYAKKNTTRNSNGNMRKKQSEYASQLKEKQKVKFIYGVLEKQFHNAYLRAEARPGKTGENLLQIMECRLDNVVRYYVEGSNMPATSEALKLLRLSPKILTAGAKASGSGGVVVSALEMAQNSIRYNWTPAQVDEKLRDIMGSIYDASVAAAEEYGLGYDLIAGNDIAAFKRMSEAMIAQGL